MLLRSRTEPALMVSDAPANAGVGKHRDNKERGSNLDLSERRARPAVVRGMAVERDKSHDVITS
jgi:hypothetical protein